MKRYYRGMCPYCFELTKTVIEVTININDDAIYVKPQDPTIRTICKKCGYPSHKMIKFKQKLAKKINVIPAPYGKFITLDNDISEAISELNKKGILTEYSCSGHNNIKPYIKFNITKCPCLDNLPEPWRAEIDVDNDKYIIRSTVQLSEDDCLDKLITWIDSLKLEDIYNIE